MKSEKNDRIGMKRDEAVIGKKKPKQTNNNSKQTGKWSVHLYVLEAIF